MTKRVVALISVLALASCVSAPTRTPRETAISPSHLGLGKTSAPAIAMAWWRTFHDRQLDALVEAALADNPSLHTALARMRAAKSALSANIAASLPQITLDAEEQRARFSKAYIIPPPFGGRTEWIGTTETNLSWSIDLWGKQAATIEKSRKEADAASYDEEAARLALSGAVVDAYVEIDRANALVSIAEEDRDDRARTLALTKTRYDNGLENKGSVKDAEALLAQANEDVTRRKAAREILIHQLATLIGQGAGTYAGLAADGAMQTDDLALPQTLPADLLGRRPDILAAKARVEAAVAGREAAHAAFYPDIDLLAFAGWAAVGLAPMFSDSALTYGAGPALHLPIFDAGKLRAEYAGATAVLDESVADYNAVVLNAVRETSDALTQWRSVQAQRPDEERALSDAETSFALAETRYRNGLSSRIELLEAEDTLLRARRDKADLDAGDLTSRVALVMAVGGGFSDEHAASDRKTQDDPR